MLRYKTKEELEKVDNVTFNKDGRAKHNCGFVTVRPEYFGKICQKEIWCYEPWMVTTKPLPSAKADRYNEGKVDLSLIPTEAVVQECRVWEHGAKKYSRDNWKKMWGDDTINVVMASALRHMFAILDGQKDDPETGLPHAAHVRCNCAMLLEYYKQQEEKESK